MALLELMEIYLTQLASMSSLPPVVNALPYIKHKIEDFRTFVQRKCGIRETFFLSKDPT